MTGPALVYGLHAVQALLERAARQVQRVWYQDSRGDARLERILVLARGARIPLAAVPRAQLDVLARGGRHQGVVAATHVSAPAPDSGLPALLSGLDEPALLLVLDGVQDPHNLGACLRCADAAGAHAVIVPRDRAAGLGPAVRKAAAGAAESVPFLQVTNLARALRELQGAGLWIVGTAGEAQDTVYTTDLRGAVALVLGGEEKGLRRLTREHCDLLVRIPMHGTVASLNVSVAAGIALFEARRQRGI